MAVTETDASISIYGKSPSASTAAVTEALGLEPTFSYEFGDPHPSKRPPMAGTVREHSYWSYEEPSTSASPDDFHGMRSLDRLAERFEEKAVDLAALRERYEIRVRLLAHSDSTQGGFVIGPETMRRLGALSASLFGNVFLDDAPAAPGFGADASQGAS